MGNAHEILYEQYPSTSHFGDDLRMHAIDAAFLPTRVSVRDLPFLVLRFLATGLTLTKCVWQLPAGTPGMDFVRLIFDDVGHVIFECHQVKESDVDGALSSGEACKLVKSMRNRCS